MADTLMHQLRIQAQAMMVCF